MFPNFICVATLLFFDATLCNALTIPIGEGSLVSTPALPFNISSPTDIGSTTSSNDWKFQIDCQGAKYGTGLRYNPSCLDAFSTFTNGGAENPVQVGRRGTGEGYAQNLPWRWVSADGRCIFDVNKSGRAPYETTSGAEVARAAWKLMTQCVRDQKGQGGIVTNIGKKGTLSITIRPYNPTNIQCGTTPQHYEEDKCEPLLDIIPADTTPARTWGPRNQRGIDMPLPHAWTAQPPNDRCRLLILGTNIQHPAIDRMAFFDMWEAAVMMQGMCARFGKPGLAKLLGSQKLLWATLDDGTRVPYMGESASSTGMNETLLTLEAGTWGVLTA